MPSSKVKLKPTISCRLIERARKKIQCCEGEIWGHEAGGGNQGFI